MKPHTDILIAGLSATIRDLCAERDALRALAQSRADDAETFKMLLTAAWEGYGDLERRHRRQSESYYRLRDEARELRRLVAQLTKQVMLSVTSRVTDDQVMIGSHLGKMNDSQSEAGW